MTNLDDLIWRSTCGSYTVVLEPSCAEAMQELARKHYPREIGTSLCGRYSDDARTAVVVQLAPLTSDSRGARSTFVRGVIGLRAFFLGLFARTQGQMHYVGEWHSHPDGEPVPSNTDSDNMQAIACDEKAQCPECILVIMATKLDSVSMRAFIYSRTRGKVELISPGAHLAR